MPYFTIWNCFPNNVWGLGLDQQNYMQVRVGATFIYTTNNKLKLCSAHAAKGTEVMMIDAKLKSFQFRTQVVQSYLENRKQQCLINNDFPASERLLFLLCRNDLPNYANCKQIYSPLTIRRRLGNLYCDLNNIFMNSSKPIKPSKTKCMFISSKQQKNTYRTKNSPPFNTFSYCALLNPCSFKCALAYELAHRRRF